MGGLRLAIARLDLPALGVEPDQRCRGRLAGVEQAGEETAVAVRDGALGGGDGGLDDADGDLADTEQERRVQQMVQDRKHRGYCRQTRRLFARTTELVSHWPAKPRLAWMRRSTVAISASR